MIDQGATPPGQRAKKKKAIWWMAALVAFLAFIVAVKPAYHWLKSKRADQFAAAGNELVREGKWNDAAGKYRAALQLDPANYQGLHGAARLASKAERPEATGLWEQVVKLPQSTVEDRQEYAGLLIDSGKLNLAERILEPLLKSNPDAKTLLLASRFSARNGENPKAIEFARLAAKRIPNKDGPQFQLAQLQAQSTSQTDQAEARKILWALAGKEGEFKNGALEALARAPQLSLEEKKRVLELLTASGTNNVTTDLLASDLRVQIQPEDADHIYDQTIERWRGGSSDQLIQLARWLNVHQQYERVLSLFALEQAFENNQLLLTHLDALAGLQRWNAIDELLNRPEVTLDPCVVESFRARTAAERGGALDAEAHWNHAISLAGTDADRLRFVANFAEQSHANDAALKAYEELTHIPEETKAAYLGIERVGRRTGDATTERTAAEKVAAAAPDDPNAANHLAYLNLLLNNDVDSNTVTAKSLAEKYPDRLSYRVTAALGCLRQDDPSSALAQFKAPVPIDWKRTQPAWRAVYAAALAANGRKDEAQAMVATIPLDRLNSEERALVGTK